METDFEFSEQKFQSLAESFPDSFIQYDLEGRILYLNRKLCRDLNVKPEDVIGKLPIEVWPDGRFASIDEAVHRALEKGETNRVEFWQAINTPDAHYHQVHVVPARDSTGKIFGVYAFGYDLTELKYYGHFLQTLMNTIPDLIWYKNRNGIYTMCNARFETFFGSSESEIVGKTDYDLIDKELADRFYKHDQLALNSNGPVKNEEWITFAGDGHRELVETIRIPIHDVLGERIGVLGIARDITEREKIVRELRSREQEFRSLSENSPDNIIRYDVNCRQIYANQPVKKVIKWLLKRTPSGETPNEAYPDGSFQEYEKILREVIATGETREFEFVLPDRGNGIEHHLIRMAAEKNDSGEIIGAVAFGHDITAIREHERRLYLLEYAMERMLDGSILVDRNARILDINGAECNMLGYEKGELLGRSLFEIAPALSAENWDAHWKRIIDSGGLLKFETLNRTRDGRDIPVEASIRVFNFEGNEYNLAIIRNITDRKKSEEQLRMAASVFEAAREGITFTDPKGLILDVNPAFTHITGFEKDEVKGKRPNILSSGKHDRSFYEAMWSDLLTNGSWSGEITNRRKTGELYSERLDIIAVKDRSGKLKHYIGIFSDISHLKKHESKLQYIAYHDSLTGLPNRLLLTDRLSMAIARAHRSGKMLAVCYLDLDNFKPVNDQHGHQFGDRVLVEIAQRISSNLRESDTVARIGGDEFVILFSEIADIEECEFIAHRLLMMISRPVVLDGVTMNLTASIGISLYPDDHQEDPDILLRSADQAMYYAKSVGRNHFVFFNVYAHEKVNIHNRTIHDLREALVQNQISVYYQPIVNLESGEIVKAEALVRWHHPVHGMIPPDDFIPVAENGGLIHEIGDFVFKESARVAHTWNQLKSMKQKGQVRISINRSPRQFFKVDSVQSWKKYLEEQNLSGSLLVVEITEGLLLDDRPDVYDQIRQLRDMGASISLDDFGTGYSALSYLKKFRIDYLKIDRSFIRDITEDPDAQAIVESIIAMARRLGIQVVAEGVETSRQADILKSAACDMAQGYFYAHPMPEEEFLAYVSKEM